MKRFGVEILAALIIFLGGVITGLGLSHPSPGPKPEPTAPAVRQGDGSLILERRPEAPPSLPELPEGSKVIRAASVTLEPIQAPGPVRLELITIQTPEGGTRQVVASPDGRVVGGTDWAPVGPPAPKAGPWALGPAVGWDMDGRRRLGGMGAWSRGPVSVVAAVVPGQGANLGILIKF